MVKDDSEEIVISKNGDLQPIPPGYEMLKKIEQQPSGPPHAE